MRFRPKEVLTTEETHSKLALVIRDGLTTEAMSVLTGGAFLVALALKLGASNFQIGVLASVGTIASIFQLAAIYLIQKYRNRRAIVVYTSFIARTSLVLIACLPFLFAADISLNLIIAFLFLHHTLGAIAGLCWTSWMKDLIPEHMLGSFFGQRSRGIQIISIVMNFLVAFALDYIKQHYPNQELLAYCVMFVLGAIAGLYGVYLLARTPEPRIQMTEQNILNLFIIPFKNFNFKNLMVFHALWLFAINLASPFFTVYLLKTLAYPLSYVISLTIIGQVTNILFIRVWGKYSDKYSNKSILQVCCPIYLFCILAWTFTTLPYKHEYTLPLLVLIHIFSGISVSGVNLALNNIGLKLAPKGDGVFYISAKSILNAAIGGIAPIFGGLFADFFSSFTLSWDLKLNTPQNTFLFHTLDLEQWDFFFALAFILGLVSLYRLTYVKEAGEVEEKVIVSEVLQEITLSSVTGLKSMIEIPITLFSAVKKRIRPHEEEERIVVTQKTTKIVD